MLLTISLRSGLAPHPKQEFLSSGPVLYIRYDLHLIQPILFQCSRAITLVRRRLLASSRISSTSDRHHSRTKRNNLPMSWMKLRRHVAVLCRGQVSPCISLEPSLRPSSRFHIVNPKAVVAYTSGCVHVVLGQQCNTIQMSRVESVGIQRKPGLTVMVSYFYRESLYFF